MGLMGTERLLCGICVSGMIAFAAVRVDARTPERGYERLDYSAGPELVRAAQAAHDAGAEIRIDNTRPVGMYAEVMYEGTGVCLAHVAFLLAGKPHVRGW